MMYVVCFYWQGDRWQEEGNAKEVFSENSKGFINKVGRISHDLPSVYVNNLYEGVKRFAEESFHFICFTNEDLDLQEGIEKRDLPFISQKGILPRLYIFSRQAGLFGHQVLILDLDVVIVGSLKDIMKYRGRFCARGRFKPRYEHQIDGDIMSFRAEEETEKIFYKPFVDNPKKIEQLTGGKERYWIREVMKDKKVDLWNFLFPDQIISYKWHVKYKRQLPENARIISCHGVPRPHQIKDKWIKYYWSQYKKEY